MKYKLLRDYCIRNSQQVLPPVMRPHRLGESVDERLNIKVNIRVDHYSVADVVETGVGQLQAAHDRQFDALAIECERQSPLDLRPQSFWYQRLHDTADGVAHQPADGHLVDANLGDL